MTNAPIQFVIYDHPSDFPENFVVRRWLISGGEDGIRIVHDETWICSTLAEAREIVATEFPGGYCLGRQADDDPVIVEVWT